MKMKYISFMLLAGFLSSPCFAKKLVFKAVHSSFFSSPDASGKVFTDWDSNGVVTVSGDFGKIYALPAQVTKGHISITAGGKIVSIPSSMKDVAEEVKKTGTIKVVEWDFIVPEGYHNEEETIIHPKSFAELYAQGQEAIKYELETEEMPEPAKIIYQVGSLGMPFYQEHLPLSAITKSGPNGGGGAGAYKAQFFSWGQGAMSQEQIQEFVKAMEDSYGGEIEITPFYFNSPAVASQFQQRVLSERELEAIEKGFVDDSVSLKMFYNRIKEGKAEFDPNFSVAKIWADNEDYAEELANGGVVGFKMEVPVVSALGYRDWTIYGNNETRKVKEYGLEIFSHQIKDYSSMKGMMLIGPNGGGGAGAYMLGN